MTDVHMSLIWRALQVSPLFTVNTGGPLLSALAVLEALTADNAAWVFIVVLATAGLVDSLHLFLLEGTFHRFSFGLGCPWRCCFTFFSFQIVFIGTACENLGLRRGWRPPFLDIEFG